MVDGDFFYDEQAARLVSQVERSIIRLMLDSQGEFVAICNALLMQIESGLPVDSTVQHLCEALQSLAQGRGVDTERIRLPQRLEQLQVRLRTARPR